MKKIIFLIKSWISRFVRKISRHCNFFFGLLKTITKIISKTRYKKKFSDLKFEMEDLLEISI